MGNYMGGAVRSQRFCAPQKRAVRFRGVSSKRRESRFMDPEINESPQLDSLIPTSRGDPLADYMGIIWGDVLPNNLPS